MTTIKLHTDDRKGVIMKPELILASLELLSVVIAFGIGVWMNIILH